MATQVPVTDEIFPKHTGKTYTLVELTRGESPLVGKGPDDTVFSFPVVLLWEIVLLLGVTLAIFLFSLVKQAPLEEIANPLITTDPAKAPWYFVGLQELLEHMHPTLAGVIIPTLLVLFLIALPYVDHSRANVGVWFSSARGRRIVAWVALYTLIVMPAYIALENRFSLRELLREVAPPWVSQWLLPTVILAALVTLPAVVVWRFPHPALSLTLGAARQALGQARPGGVAGRASIREVMLVLFTVMFISAIVFTVSGFLFRGPGFKLYWPWQMPDGYSPWDGL